MTKVGWASVVSGVLFVACGGSAGEPPAMTESQAGLGGESVQEAGYILPGMEHGVCQSPINIITADTEEATHRVALHYQTSRERITNLGHTVQVNYDDGSTVEFDGAVYHFKQFHFHTPSEHLVDGITYPMELHLVHTRADDDETYLVVGVLFRDGDRNEFIDDFVAAIPPQEGEEVNVSGGAVDISKLFDGEPDYYHYRGSLTTPPYTESVQWAILKQIREASPEQIATFNRLEGDNARHVQAIHGRSVDAN